MTTGMPIFAKTPYRVRYTYECTEIIWADSDEEAALLVQQDVITSLSDQTIDELVENLRLSPAETR